MQAVTIVNNELQWNHHPDPVPGDHDLLVAVKAAGINAGDLVQVKGFYPAPAGFPVDIPGMELAGEVTSTGAKVTKFQVGDRVMAIVGGGARPLEEKASIAADMVSQVLPLLAERQVTVPVDRTFPMADAASAYEYFRAGGKFGKVVLTND